MESGLRVLGLNSVSKGQERRSGKRWVWGGLWLVITALLTGLGFWQLDRAALKQRWLSAQERPALSVLPEWEVSALLNQQPWLPVDLNVEWLDQPPRFLDNRTHSGQAGYEVLVPAKLKDGRTFVVNLGWVAAPAVRSLRPTLNLNAMPTTARGVIGYPPKTYVLDQVAGDVEWRLQSIRLDRLSQSWNTRLEPWVLWLQEQAPENLVARLPGSGRMTPERHLGYAVQWFSLALVFLGLGLWLLKRGGHGQT